MDNIIKINLINFITVGLMAFIAVFLINKAAAKIFPLLSLSGAASSTASAPTA